MVKQGTTILGNRTRVKVVKNKVAPPFKTAEFDIMYGEGVSRESSLIDIAADLDIINKSGSWYSYEGTRLGQGKDTVKEFLKANPEAREEIESKLQEMLKDEKVLARLTGGGKKSKLADKEDSE